MTVANVSISGTGTTATVNENLGYAGSLDEGAGSTLSIASSDILTLTGTSSLAGTVSGAGTLALADGRTAFDSGATLTIGSVSISGTGTTATVNEDLSYAGSLIEGAGSALSIASSDILTLTGTSSFAGTVSGAGTLSLAGGRTAFDSGAKLSVADWSISGAGTGVTLGEALTYAKAFSEGAGATVSLTGGNLTLTGSASLAGGTVNGSHSLKTKGTTTVSGLTIGGTVVWDNTETVTQSGGAVTIGGANGYRAELDNASTGIYDIVDDSGIARGSSAAWYILNAGLLEKTGGKGTSAITPRINNTGAIAVTSGTLDLEAR